MKVDMSPEAVTARLRLLDQLWELSVKLMKAKEVKKPEINDRSKQDRKSRSK